MQTFLPYPSFIESARCLDYRRLGKQRVEAKQILLAIDEPKNKWRRHPAVRMWMGYETALAVYGFVMCHEWARRGYRDNLSFWFHRRLFGSIGFHKPPWVGMKEFHLSHQSNLIRKDPGFYRRLWPEIPDNLPYVWPVEA